MPNHVHLIICPDLAAYDIASIRHEIKHPVGERAIRYLAQHAPDWLPRMSRQRSTKIERLFWQSGGGYDRNNDNSTTLAHEIEYIHLNPVRRGLVERTEDWKWSSAGWYAGGVPNSLKLDVIPPEWIA